MTHTKLETSMNQLTELDVVSRGQQANAQIDSAEQHIECMQMAQRQRWIDLGLALIYGKGLNPSKPDFGKWIVANGFHNRIQQHRSAAMEVARLLPRTVRECPTSITHPERILKWLKDTATERADDASADPVLKEMPAPKKKLVLEPRPGKRIAELAKRRETGGEGADIADRALKAYAKKYDCPIDDLIEAAKAAAPEAFFQFGPAQVTALVDLYAKQANTVESMLAYGFTREQIRNVFLKFSNSI